MKYILVVLICFTGCESKVQPHYAPFDGFDLHSAIESEIKELVSYSVKKRISLTEFRTNVKNRFGQIYYESRYTDASMFDEKATGVLSDQARLLRKGESIIRLGLDADHDCIVICDQDDIIIRSGMR